MALAIKATPVLKGKEAREFSQKINSNKDRPISKEAYERTVAAMKSMKFKDGAHF
jgi:hypothetical protein